jgi:protein required for attachment to host cells
MKHKKYITWVAVLDGKKALLLTKGLNKRLEALDYAFQFSDKHTNAENNNPSNELDESIIDISRHIMEPSSSEDHKKKTHFMKDVAAYLESSLWEYDRLILAAPPRALGNLRKELSKSVQDKLVLELDENFARLRPAQIQHHLESLIPVF